MRVCHPFSPQHEKSAATHFALNASFRKIRLISGGDCPKDKSHDVIPGLDAIYCYRCQKSYPTQHGIAYGWGWDGEQLKKLKRDIEKEKKKQEKRQRKAT